MIFLYGFLILAGILNTIQSGSNATLHKQLQQPVLPALVSFGVGTVLLIVIQTIYSVAAHKPLPSAGQWASAPWWAWIGGVLGCVYVLAMVNVSEKVGAGVFTGLTVSAGIITSLVMDHFGLVGFKEHPASLPRMLGGLLMVAGLFLIGKF